MPQTHRELPPIVATIYGLTDPRDGGLRYVGRTALTVAERLHQHWLVKDRPPTQAYPVSVWLRALAADGGSKIEELVDIRDHLDRDAHPHGLDLRMQQLHLVGCAAKQVDLLARCPWRLEACAP